MQDSGVHIGWAQLSVGTQCMQFSFTSSWVFSEGSRSGVARRTSWTRGMVLALPGLA